MGEGLLLGAILLAALAGCWLALALIWNVSNRRHIRRLQQTLQESISLRLPLLRYRLCHRRRSRRLPEWAHDVGYLQGKKIPVHLL